MHTSQLPRGGVLGVLGLLLSISGCGAPEPDGDAGRADGGTTDASTTDASTTDASATDASATDASATDARIEPADGAMDAGAAGADADVPDAEPMPIPGADPTFATDGLFTLDVDPAGGRAAFSSIAVQADGKIVASGRNQEGVVLARALASGALDPAFGRGGVVVAPLGRVEIGFADRAGGVAVAPDGRIVVASYANILNELGRGQVQAVLRYRADGRPDPTFGAGGRVTTPVLPYPGNVLSTDAVVVQPDARVVVAGANTSSAQLRRFLPDGELDASFGSGGVASSRLGADYARAQSMALQPDGRIVVGATRLVGVQQGAALARFTADGALDPSFAGTGYFAGDLAFGVAAARGLALRSDGRILLGWRRATGVVGRFQSDGSLDSAFGTGGWSPSISGSPDHLAELPGGDVLASVWLSGGEDQVRLTEDGAIATMIPRASAHVLRSAARPLDDGRIASAGYRSVAETRRPVFAMQRADGTPDDTFAPEGVLDVPAGGSVDRALAMATQSDGRILVGGASGFGTSSVARLTPEGALDPTFGVGGVVRTIVGLRLVTSIAVDASGRILLGGYAQPGLSVVRLTSAGAPDPTFGADGVATADPEPSGFSRGTWMTLAPDGTILVAGFGERSGSFPDLVVARFSAGGVLDATFGDAGFARIRRSGTGTGAARVLVQPDGAIVAAVGTSPVTLARFLGDGTLDASFGSGGIVEPASGRIPSGLAIDGSGRIVLLAMSAPGGDVRIHVRRYLPDGSADATFGTGGEVVEDLGAVDYPDPYLSVANEPAPMGLLLLPGGDILVAAATSSDALTERALLLRLTDAGVPDASFGAGGRRILPLGTASSSLYAALLQSDGRTLLAGRSWNDPSGSDFAIVRLE